MLSFKTKEKIYEMLKDIRPAIKSQAKIRGKTKNIFLCKKLNDK